MSATCLTEFARHRLFQIAAREGFWRTANVAEPFGWHQHKHVGCSAADVLTFTAVALRFQAWFALSNVSNFPAIASAFERHLKSSACVETLHCTGFLHQCFWGGESRGRRRRLRWLPD